MGQGQPARSSGLLSTIPRPDWEGKTAFPENDRTTLLKPTKVLSPWHHSALAFTDWRKLDDEIG